MSGWLPRHCDQSVNFPLQEGIVSQCMAWGATSLVAHFFIFPIGLGLQCSDIFPARCFHSILTLKLATPDLLTNKANVPCNQE